MIVDQNILDEITKFGQAHKIQFNPSKTNLLVSGKKEATNLKLCDKQITEVDNFKYLGTIIQKNITHQLHVEMKRKAAFASLNNLRTIGLLSNHLDLKNKKKLFNIYIRPVLYYGAEAMDINEREMEVLSKTDTMILKNVMGLPINTLNSELYNALALLLPQEHLFNLQLKFLVRALENDYTNKLVRNLVANVNANGLVKQVCDRLKIKDFSELQEKCLNEINRLERLPCERTANCKISLNCAKIIYSDEIEHYKKKNYLINLLHYKNIF